MIKMLKFLILVIVFVYYVKCARILAIFPTPSISHQVAFRPLVQELARKGHEIITVTTDPVYINEKAPDNLTEIDVHDLSYKILRETFVSEAVGKKDDLFTHVSLGLRVVWNVFEAQLKTKEMEEIILKKKGQFDLLLIEAYVRPAIVFSHLFKAPVIQMSSFGAFSYNTYTFGIPTHPLYYPTILNQRLYNLTNLEKIEQIYTRWQLETIIDRIELEEDEKLKNIFGPDIPPINKLMNNVDMLFLNINPIWADNQPIPPNVIFMGGIHQNPPKELPQNLQSYLDSSQNGVIYLSFGTNVQPSLLPPEKIKMFIKVFSRLPYNVLWKWDKDALPGKSDNIKIFKWLPQSDLLRHPKIKLFITQGGLQSTDEAINAGVPLIGIPMLGDQWYNVEKYVHHQIGIRLDMETISEEKFRKAIENILNDSRYRDNIARLRTLMYDQPQTPLERALWWTEYVIRHGGAKHLRSPTANISWSQYLELELVSIVLSIIIGVLVLLILSVHFLRNIVRKYFTSTKIKVT